MILHLITGEGPSKRQDTWIELRMLGLTGNPNALPNVDVDRDATAHGDERARGIEDRDDLMTAGEPGDLKSRQV